MRKVGEAIGQGASVLEAPDADIRPQRGHGSSVCQRSARLAKARENLGRHQEEPDVRMRCQDENHRLMHVGTVDSLDMIATSNRP